MHATVFNSGFERMWKLGQWHLGVEEGVGGGEMARGEGRLRSDPSDRAGARRVMIAPGRLVSITMVDEGMLLSGRFRPSS